MKYRGRTCMNDEIVCLVCGCRVQPYNKYFEIVNSKNHLKKVHRWLCPLCDAEVKC